MDLNREVLSSITVYSKYAKFLPDQHRRESWQEIGQRYRDMHVKKFPALQQEIDEAVEYVAQKKILPSMRMAQFSGKPIELNPARGYNCGYMSASDVAFLSLI